MQTIYDAKILIVDDNQDLLNLVTTALRSTGYNQLTACTGCAAAQAAFAANRPDLMILDINLPDGDGFTLFRTLHSMADIPALFLFARDADADRLFGLGLGADDYLTKPFGTAELLARVRTAIRHTRTTSANSEIAREGTYTVGEMTIDYNKHQVLVRGENVHLTLSEFRIVALLGKFAGKVLTYDYIIKELWGPRAGGDNQILRVNMANIRRKIEKNPAEPEYLFTEVGVGYRMAENTDN